MRFNIARGRRVVAINDTRGALVKASGFTLEDFAQIERVKAEQRSVVDAATVIAGSDAIAGRDQGAQAVLPRAVDILVLAGIEDTIRIDNVDAVQAILSSPAGEPIRQSLAQIGIKSAVELFGTYAGSRIDMVNWLRDAAINTDRNLRLQYLAGMWLNSNKSLEILDEITRYCRFPDELFIGSAERKQTLKLWIEGSGSGKASSSE